MTYLIAPHIHDRLSINCNAFNIVRYFNNSLTAVVLIGRLLHGVMSIQCPYTSDTRYTHKQNRLKQSLVQASRPLLPCCTTISGYHTSSDNSSSLQQPTIGYRQTSKLLLGASQPRRVKTTTHRMMQNFGGRKFWCIAGHSPKFSCLNFSLLKVSIIQIDSQLNCASKLNSILSF